MQIDDKTERRRLQSYCENDGATIETLKNWIREYKSSLSKNIPESDASPGFSYVPEPEKTWRSCAACGNPTELKDIRQVFYCPKCDLALKTAISEEKAKIPEKNSNNKPPDTS